MDEIRKQGSEACSNNNSKHSTYQNEVHDEVRVHLKHEDLYMVVNNQENLHTVSSFVKHNGFLNDQTPTPTRFFKHYEDVCSFQDINLNPFDLEFRKASQNRFSKNHLSVAENHGISGSLDTPRILPPIDSDETISSTSHDYGHGTSHDNRHHTQFSSVISSGSTSEIINQRQNVVNLICDEKKEGRKRLTLNVSSASEDDQSNSNIISTPTPVITAGPSVSQSLLKVSCSTPTLNTPNIMYSTIPHISLNGIGLGFNDLNTPALSPDRLSTSSPPPLSQSSASINKNKVVYSEASSVEALNIPQSTSATVLQLLLRLPNGQAIPVEIPATPVVTTLSSTSRTTPSVVTSIVPAYPASSFTSVITNPTPSLAKMKLKQALASSNTAARPGAPRHSRATTADRIANLTKPKLPIDAANINRNSLENNFSGADSVDLPGNRVTKPIRRKNHSPDDDPEEKRKKFLERNRVAAVRCREKKKRLVESMVSKSDELNNINLKLQGEVTSLKSEVAALKCLLLKHKTCPVTLAMQGASSTSDEMEIKDYQGYLESKPSANLSNATFISASPQFISANYKEMSQSALQNSSVQFLIPENPPLDAVSKFRKRSHSLSSISSSVPIQSILGNSEALVSGDARLLLPIEGIVKEPKPIAPKEPLIICKSSYNSVSPSSTGINPTMTPPKIIFIESSSGPVSVPSHS